MSAKEQIVLKFWGKHFSKIWAALAVLFSFGWCLHYGRIGLHPLDSSIVFDGGYRVLQGQKFFVDLHASSAFTPSWIQAGFFALFGVNWFAYILQAAIFNGLFSLLVYRLLRRFKLSPRISAIYALFSGIVFYPPFGSPYPDQHAFFFSLLAIVFSLEGRASAREGWKWSMVVPALLLAGLSKQVPSGYAAILVGFLLLTSRPPREWLKMAAWLALGVPIALALVILIFPIGEMDWQLAWYYFWEMPSQLGQDRAKSLDYPFFKSLRAVFFLQYQVLSKQSNFYLYATYWIPITGALIWSFFRWRKKLARLHAMPLSWLVCWGMLAIGGGFVLLTQNQYGNGLAFVFAAIGLVHAGYANFLNELKLVLPWKPQYWAILIAVSTGLLIVFSTSDVLKFQREVVLPRVVHDFPKGEEPHLSSNPSNNAGPGLDFLYWEEPFFGTERNPASLIQFLRAKKKSFFLWGDMSFVYGLCDQTSPIPSLWIHEGLSIPHPGSQFRQSWDSQLLNNLNQLAPAYLIYEVPDGKSYMGQSLAQHPTVNTWIEARKGEAFSVGRFIIWELDTKP